MLALHPGPDLHDGVLEFNFVGVTLKLLIVIFGVLHVVVEDVVQRYLGLVSLKEFIDDLLLSILQVTPALHHTFELIIGQFEAGYWSAANVIGISNILDYKCLVINNCSCSKPLYDELPWFAFFGFIVAIFGIIELDWGSFVVGD